MSMIGIEANYDFPEHGLTKAALKYETKYLRFYFICNSKSGKTNIYWITTVRDGTNIGTIYYYGKWRQYIFAPSTETIWNKTCLSEIITFLNSVNQKEEEKK
jgi:hypothetical protein